MQKSRQGPVLTDRALSSLLCCALQEKVLGPVGLAPAQTKSRSIYADPVDASADPRSASAMQSASGKPPRPTINKTLVWMGPKKVVLQDKAFPTMQNNHGVKVEHGVILKVIATNICGSDLHMSEAKQTANGMQWRRFGAQNTHCFLLLFSCCAGIVAPSAA